MNRTFWKLCGACLCLVMGAAHAADPMKVNVTVNNDSAEEIRLIAASWPLGDNTPASYTIPAGETLEFGVGHANRTKAQSAMRYSTGYKACLFTAGHAVKESFGWFESNKTPYQWAKGKSEGSFVATCTAKVVSSTPGVGYHVEFSMN